MLAYLVMGGGRLFSVFDLVAFLLLLAAYGFWMIVKTQYRETAGVDGSHADWTPGSACRLTKVRACH